MQSLSFNAFTWVNLQLLSQWQTLSTFISGIFFHTSKRQRTTTTTTTFMKVKKHDGEKNSSWEFRLIQQKLNEFHSFKHGSGHQVHIKELMWYFVGQIFRCLPHKSLEKPLGHFLTCNNGIMKGKLKELSWTLLIHADSLPAENIIGLIIYQAEYM